MPDQSNAPELTRPVMVCLNDDGSYSAQSFTSDEDFKIRAKCLIPSRLVVPIVFVPGIMGTRLRLKEGKGPAWFPPEGKWEQLVQALEYLKRDAAARQRLLDPANTEVDDNGIAHPDAQTAVLLGDALGKTDAERAKWRGWGQLHSDSYGDVLAGLERGFTAMFIDGKAYDPKWQQAVMDWQQAAKLGAQKPFAALERDAVMCAASVFYPVHAVGYNWLHSNQVSAEQLAG